MKKAVCEICKKEFRYYQDPRSPRRFCSMSCRNLGLRGFHPVKEVKKGAPENQHIRWKGDRVGYHGLHKWVQKHLGKPGTCEHCNKTGLWGLQIHWANKSGKYKRNKSDWLRLCAKCHKAYDKI